ncbi:MAG: hypothetical protein IT245_08870 [Bacteroidia bacterium]|nr:hypothetical protein [Bacteroidia bacterium]
MNINLPAFIGIMLVLSLALTIFCFFRASGNSIKALVVILCFVVIQGILGLSNFYTQFDTHPMRFPLLVLPSLLSILVFYLLPRSRKFLDELDPGWLTFLHIIRFPIELVLYWLFLYELVPEIMTFEGRNFDIISGLSAPFIAYWAYIKKKLERKYIIIWNLICLALLLNIVFNAILSAPGPFQQFEFGQPNIGIFYFPFVWLPSVIVPLVLLSHIACLRYHISNKNIKI